jgi:hypothetical protein
MNELSLRRGFPDFAGRIAWAAEFEPPSVAECRDVVERTGALLRSEYCV